MSERTRARWATGCIAAAALLTLVTIVVGGARFDGYDHIAQYISELGAEGAPDADLVSWGSFVPTGLLVGAAIALLWPSLAVARSRRAAIGVTLVGAGLALGYVVSGMAPCDAGCPEDGGSTSQQVHTAVSVVYYTAALVGLALVAWRSRLDGAWARLVVAARVAVVAVLVLSWAMTSGSFDAGRGLLQRIVEAVLFGWLLLAAAVVERRAAVSPGG